MAAVYGANVTKYRAGGSGDNYIADGYIKTVEKIWLDSYDFTGPLATSSQILIAKIPKNKKITDIVVHLPIMGTAGSMSTVYACTGATTSTATYFGALSPNTIAAAGANQATACTVRLTASVLGTMTPLAADTDIYIMINAAGSATTGTIRTMVKYV